jgi:5-methylcytosine-specific restriction endonuclease McrA
MSIYRVENNERIKKRVKTRNNSPTKEINLMHRLSPDDQAELDQAGYVTVSCKHCRNRFTPTYTAVVSRVKSIEGKAQCRGDNNFYCSDECKNSCPIFGFKTAKQIDPRSKLYVPKTEAEFARKCQTNHLKQLQCDEYGHNFCERCGDIIDVELHHTLEVSKNGEKAISSAGHILLCWRCHKNVDC